MNQRTKKITTLAMLTALAFLVMVVGRVSLIAAAPFLRYDPKDVIITIGGFIFGPLSAFVIAVVVSVIEMLTVSNTGPYGLLMNIVSSSAFACTAAYCYRRWKSMKGAVAGLVAGVVAVTIVMVIWNYFIIPLYTGSSREDVAAMLVPIFLPFNLVKGTLNAAITMLLYKPVVRALRRSNLLPESASSSGSGKINPGAMLASALVLVTMVMLVLLLKGIL